MGASLLRGTDCIGQETVIRFSEPWIEKGETVVTITRHPGQGVPLKDAERNQSGSIAVKLADLQQLLERYAQPA